MRHPGTAGGAFIEHFNIIAVPNGYRLDREDKVFTSLDELVLHHCTNKGALPCTLDIPQALKTAQTPADIQSLAILEEEFWKSPHSRLVPGPHQSRRKSQLTGSTAFMLTIQRTSPDASDDLMDTRETKDRILSLFETDNRTNVNRHSWSDTGSDAHLWNKSNYGHRRAASDANRQIMRYSNDAEQLDLSHLQRHPPPTSPPPLPPTDPQLSFFQDSPNQSCTVISRTNRRDPFKQVRVLSSEGSSVRSQSTISDDSMGRDSICSSSSFSSHSRQSNSSLQAISDSVSRLSEHFSINQQPQVSLQDREALVKESPYDVPIVTAIPDVVSHQGTCTNAFSGTTPDFLDFSVLESRGDKIEPITSSISSLTLSEFDPLLVAPPPEFGDDAVVGSSVVETGVDASEQYNAVSDEKLLVSFDDDGNLQLIGADICGDPYVPTDWNASTARTGSGSERDKASDLSMKRESVGSEGSGTSSVSGEYIVVDRRSSELGEESRWSSVESSPVKRNSHGSSLRSSSDFSGKFHIPIHKNLPTTSGNNSQRSSSDLSGKCTIPTHETSPVNSGSNSQRCSSDLSGQFHVPTLGSSPAKTGNNSQHSSSDLSGNYHIPSHEGSPVKSGSNSQRSSSELSGNYHIPTREGSPVKTGSNSQRSSSDLSGKYHMPSIESSPVKIGSTSQRSSSDSSGKFPSPTHERSPVKTGSNSQRSSADSSGKYPIPTHDRSPVKTGSNSQRSSSDSSGKYQIPTCESSLAKAGENSIKQVSSSRSSVTFVQVGREEPSTLRDSVNSGDRSSTEFSGRADSNGSSPAKRSVRYSIQRSSSEIVGEFDVSGSPVGESEVTDDDDKSEAQAARMKRCLSLPAPLMRGTDEEGVFQGSKSALFAEEVQEDGSLGGEEDFEIVNHPTWSSENLNSNRTPEESSSTTTPKSKKHRKLQQIRHLAKKSTKKVHKKIRPSWNKKLEILDPAASIQEVVKRLAGDPTSRLGAMVDSFISSTVDKCESHTPDAVLKSLRQFMSGVKNYLFNDQEKEVEAQLDKYCNLTGMEVDAIFEGALHQILLEPLKDQIYLCFIKHFNQSESLKLLDRNIRSAKEKSPEELGIKDKFIPPAKAAMISIKERFTDIQKAFSPLQKLEYLLHVVREIYSSVFDSTLGSNAMTSMGADDFLPMLIYVLVHCDQIHIEIEVEYMWGLLDPPLLSGEGGYYLTTLSSAICVLKQFEEETECETKGFVTVFVARSSQPGDIVMKTVPVLPAMTAVEVCNVIIQKLNLDSDTPHHIFLLDQGQEHHLEIHCSIFKIKTDYEAVKNTLCKFCIRAENVVVKWPIISANLQPAI
ncbi:uncharacterized protein [Apostichopus japonicus]